MRGDPRHHRCCLPAPPGRADPEPGGGGRRAGSSRVVGPAPHPARARSLRGTHVARLPSSRDVVRGRARIPRPTPGAFPPGGARRGRCPRCDATFSKCCFAASAGARSAPGQLIHAHLHVRHRDYEAGVVLKKRSSSTKGRLKAVPTAIRARRTRADHGELESKENDASGAHFLERAFVAAERTPTMRQSRSDAQHKSGAPESPGQNPLAKSPGWASVPSALRPDATIVRSSDPY